MRFSLPLHVKASSQFSLPFLICRLFIADQEGKENRDDALTYNVKRVLTTGCKLQLMNVGDLPDQKY